MTHATVDLDRFDAVLFDLDGVLTTTARLHSESWKQLFDEFLDEWDAEQGVETAPFSIAEDYARHVDGKPRDDGVRDFLASRSIEVPEGTIDSPPDERSINGLGNRKQTFVDAAINEVGVEAFPGSVAWARQVRAAGLATAVVSSSRNCEVVLRAAGIDKLFDTRVDGVTANELGLPGKPAPDTFIEAARRLEVDPSRAIVVEDAISGVEAGRAGNFGLVVGVDRMGQADALAQHGADLVVADLGELVSTPAQENQPAGPKEHRLLAAADRLLAVMEEYPVDEFRLVEQRFKPEAVPQLETMFAITNGYLGIRGSHDEGTPVHGPATLLNGFHETWPLEYPERAYGFATTGQTILRVADAALLRLYLDDEPFNLTRVEILDYERALNMRAGTVDRRVTWRAADGRRFTLNTRRLASLAHRHLACFDYRLSALDGTARVVLVSELAKPNGHTPTDDRDPRRRSDMSDALRLESGRSVDDRMLLTFETRTSGLRMGCGADHILRSGHLVRQEAVHVNGRGRMSAEIELSPERPIRLEKHVAYHYGEAAELDSDELEFRVSSTLDRARADGFDNVLAEQRRRLDDFWSISDVRTEGAPHLQQAVRFSLFQIMQATARVEGHGLPSKGLTGAGYEGHYFWDTEIYVMPVLTYTRPEIAKHLLRHRYDMLDAARRRASEVAEKGALFPWRTITGEEASAYYAAGTAQYHINADVAYALIQYVQATGDREFLARYGVEMLIETARLWAGLGFFSDRHDGKFVINGVTGPDEYSTVVDNNAFTNLMARRNLRAAARAVDWMRTAEPDSFARLSDKVDLEADEPASWIKAAEAMFIPFDERQGIHLQDDDFLDREVWDFEGTPPEDYPLLLHYHPLVIYRHQVIKQADVVLAMFLLSEEFTEEEKRRCFEYYDPLTTGDSSLSECIQSIAASEVGQLRAAEEYFVDAVAIDLADTAGNVADGIHVASAAGSWLVPVFGMGGMRHGPDGVSFHPRIPRRLTRLQFCVRLGECVLEVSVDDEATTYTLREGERVEIRHWSEPVVVTSAEPLRLVNV